MLPITRWICQNMSGQMLVLLSLLVMYLAARSKSSCVCIWSLSKKEVSLTCQKALDSGSHFSSSHQKTRVLLKTSSRKEAATVLFRATREFFVFRFSNRGQLHARETSSAHQKRIQKSREEEEEKNETNDDTRVESRARAFVIRSSAKEERDKKECFYSRESDDDDDDGPVRGRRRRRRRC